MATIPSSAALIAAARDDDLLARLVARGEAHGYPQAQIEAARRRLVAAPADDSGTATIASVYEYATSRRAEALAKVPPQPGVDPAMVTDTHLDHALAHVLGPAPTD